MGLEPTTTGITNHATFVDLQWEVWKAYKCMGSPCALGRPAAQRPLWLPYSLGNRPGAFKAAGPVQPLPFVGQADAYKGIAVGVQRAGDADGQRLYPHDVVTDLQPRYALGGRVDDFPL